MSIQLESHHDITIVYLSGVLNALSVPKIQAQLEQLIQAEMKFILEMSQVELLSSLGLWMLIELHRKMKDQNSKIIIAQPSEATRISVNSVGLESYLLIFDTLAQGLAHLEANQAES